MSHIFVHPTGFVCQACGEEFTAETIQNVSFDTWITHMKSIFCPKCGAHWQKLSIKMQPAEEV